MRKTLMSLILGAYLSVCGCSETVPRPVEPVIEQKPIVVEVSKPITAEVSKLLVTPTKRYTKLFVSSSTSGNEFNLSRAAGEKQLRELAETSFAEEIWFYHNNLWKDISPKSQLELAWPEKSDVIMQHICSQDLKPGQEISIYHIHPDLAQRVYLGWSGCAAPSSLDVMFHSQMKERMNYSEYPQKYPILSQVKFSSKVVDSSGVWTYDVNNNLMLDLNLRAGNFSSFMNIESVLLNANLGMDEFMELYTYLIKKYGVDIKYEKFKR